MPERAASRPVKMMLRIGISAVLLGVLVRRVEWSELLNQFSQARPQWLFAVLAVLLFCRFYASYRWWVLLRLHHREVEFLPIVKLTFATCFLQVFLPTGSREVLRVVGHTRSSSKLSAALVSVVAEQYFGVIALAVLTLIGVAAAAGPRDLRIIEWALVCLAAMLTGSLLVMNHKLRRAADAVLARLAPRGMQRRLTEIYECLDQLRGSPKLLLLSFALAIGNQLLRVIAVILAATALRLEVPVLWFFAYVPAIIFLQLLPISVGGLGVRESAYVYFFGLVGVLPTSAFALSMIAYVGMLIASLPGAWFCTEVFADRRSTAVANHGNHKVQETA